MLLIFNLVLWKPTCRKRSWWSSLFPLLNLFPLSSVCWVLTPPSWVKVRGTENIILDWYCLSWPQGYECWFFHRGILWVMDKILSAREVLSAASLMHVNVTSLLGHFQYSTQPKANQKNFLDFLLKSPQASTSPSYSGLEKIHVQLQIAYTWANGPLSLLL